MWHYDFSDAKTNFPFYAGFSDQSAHFLGLTVKVESEKRGKK